MGATCSIDPDHLNTPRLIADSTGTTVWRWDQGEPFGNEVPNNNPSGAGAFDFPLRFPGQYFDRETNLAYNFFRDYDPGIGRYVESDPIGLKGGLNTYTYVRLDPLGRVDPMGLDDTLGGGGGGGEGSQSLCTLILQIPIGILPNIRGWYCNLSLPDIFVSTKVLDRPKNSRWYLWMLTKNTRWTKTADPTGLISAIIPHGRNMVRLLGGKGREASIETWPTCV